MTDLRRGIYGGVVPFRLKTSEIPRRAGKLLVRWARFGMRQVMDDEVKRLVGLV